MVEQLWLARLLLTQPTTRIRCWRIRVAHRDGSSALHPGVREAGLDHAAIGPRQAACRLPELQGSRIHHLKELRPGSGDRSEIRVCSSRSIPPGRRRYCSAATRPGAGSAGTGKTS